MQKAIIDNTIEQAKLFGILKYLADGVLTHAPFSLSPYTISSTALQEMTSLTAPFSELMIAVSQDWDFLKYYLDPIAETDLFLRMLLDFSLKEVRQQRQLLIQRNDFFIVKNQFEADILENTTSSSDSCSSVLRQVELNTVSASFPFLITQLSQLHNSLYEQGLFPQTVANNPLTAVVDAFAQAIRGYAAADAVLLMVIQAAETNLFDQLGLEHLLWKEHKIKTIRKTLPEIYSAGSLREGHLIIDGKTAAVTYYRAGYTPDDYRTPEALKGRQLLEASSTIQVPDLAMQLAGMKKIQQVLTHPEILSEFVSPEVSKRLLKTFAKMHSLDENIKTPAGEMQVSEWVSMNPEKYVLKPQREGGGNNYFESEIPVILQKIRQDEQDAYILMEKIEAEIHSATLVVNGHAETLSCVSEVGRYGICFAENGKLKSNEDIGYLVRTKSENVNEGGVCTGFACLNSLAVQ
ncbi:MAG: glutathione synthase [SAR324 cluster bacterium]|nr:glutathione synthase [SAR324 cluster bacterium]MBL7034641.1 glutathione synthase [SAR324 cluster bacterium]